MNIIDHTHVYNGKVFYRYIEKALVYIPKEHVKGIENINIYDQCFSNSPVIALGGHYPLTAKKGAEIDRYLDQNFGHMLSLHKKQTSLTKILDGIFIHTFGKLFIVHTLFHEIGHHVYGMSATSRKEDDNASEEYAENYANDFYGKVYPLAQKHYSIINKLYHFIYGQRIAKDNVIRQQGRKM